MPLTVTSDLMSKFILFMAFGREKTEIVSAWLFVQPEFTRVSVVYANRLTGTSSDIS